MSFFDLTIFLNSIVTFVYLFVGISVTLITVNIKDIRKESIFINILFKYMIY